MVNDNSLSDSVLIQIGALEKDIKDLEDILSHLEHSGESGRGYDRQVANIKNQIQQKTKQIQQFKRSINMNDTMAQLAMIGITQDAEDPDKKFNAFIQKHGWPTNYEESKALLEKAKKEGIHPDYIHGMERGLKAMANKDDDATEHGSIETYGKEKETETMPLEKNPVQAQDAYQNGEHVKVKNHGTGEVIELKVLKDNGDGTLEVKAPNGAVITIKESWIYKGHDRTTQDSTVNYKGWKIVTEPDPRKGYSGYVANIIRPNGSRPYDGTANHKVESEAIEECKKLIDLYVKEGVGGVKDEEPNHVQDSYEMLKLCGIVS